MHLVTSSLFLPIAISQLVSTESKERVLRTFLHFALAAFVDQGRPQIDIGELYNRNFPRPQLVSDEGIRYNISPGLQTDSMTWQSLIQVANLHYDQHLCKIQRSLFHFATLYGNKRKGNKEFIETGLEGAERLDGGIFLQAALLVNARMTRDLGEGKKPFYDLVTFLELTEEEKESIVILLENAHIDT